MTQVDTQTLSGCRRRPVIMRRFYITVNGRLCCVTQTGNKALDPASDTEAVTKHRCVMTWNEICDCFLPHAC